MCHLPEKNAVGCSVFLFLQIGDGKLQKLKFLFGKPIIFGRSEAMGDVIISHCSVSNLHVAIVLSELYTNSHNGSSCYVHNIGANKTTLQSIDNELGKWTKINNSVDETKIFNGMQLLTPLRMKHTRMCQDERVRVGIKFHNFNKNPLELQPIVVDSRPVPLDIGDTYKILALNLLYECGDTKLKALVD